MSKKRQAMMMLVMSGFARKWEQGSYFFVDIQTPLTAFFQGPYRVPPPKFQERDALDPPFVTWLRCVGCFALRCGGGGGGGGGSMLIRATRFFFRASETQFGHV